jgi:HTH-type transcriptional regulator/antitoxin HigA
MTKTGTAFTPSTLPKKYEELVALHVPRPIHDQVDFDNVMELIDRLSGARLNSEQEDYLEILATLVEAYERETLKPLRPLPANELLAYLLEENEMKKEDLAKLLEVERSLAFKILKGSRNLTAEHIRKLCERFKVSADLFIGAIGRA